MIRMSYKINGKKVELGTNSDGSGLFRWSDAESNWKQLTADSVCQISRMNDKKYVRRTVYNFYCRRFS